MKYRRLLEDVAGCAALCVMAVILFTFLPIIGG